MTKPRRTTDKTPMRKVGQMADKRERYEPAPATSSTEGWVSKYTLPSRRARRGLSRRRNKAARIARRANRRSKRSS